MSAAYSQTMRYLSSHLKQSVETRADHSEDKPPYQVAFDFFTFPNVQIFYISSNL